MLLGCQQLVETFSSEGRLYKEDILNSIKKADVIKITEHSDPIDFYDDTLEVQKKYIEKVYQTLELTGSQKENFINTIQTIDNKTQYEFPACEPEVHHTITFYKRGSLFSTMAICFECGQIEWDGTKHTPPLGIYRGMENFVNKIGFHSERDWEQLAKNNK